ncbi:glycosyltransferase family 2 protein [Rhabdochromatium marinum]|uniref:glycosyltransferase family 2 protein n=1 Tax=Rhabdochromatium marinum TaxID=48729 RepID=UPI0019079550|nr:glycosyltransferase family 2 protein [Rhabdochromatium marinum]MBK1647755.1 glycosyl transferase [Rhabdochromatium marinum]
MVLIPARNEGHSIAALVLESRRLTRKPVVVINDCSTDDTAVQARAAGAIVLDLPVRLGAWGATQTGLRYAVRQQWPLAVTLDADGQHEASRIDALTTHIHHGQADVVIGACPDRASVLRRLAWHYLRWLAGINLIDITSGFRAYGRAAIERLAQPDATLLDYQDIGVLMILNRQGLRIHEVPVPMKPRLHGHSRVFDSWWTVAGYMIKTSVLCLARVGQRVQTGGRA